MSAERAGTRKATRRDRLLARRRLYVRKKLGAARERRPHERIRPLRSVSSVNVAVLYWAKPESYRDQSDLDRSRAIVAR